MFETIAVTAPTDEAGHGAERVAREQHDVGGRLDVRDRREREPPDHRQRRERRHEREHARGRLARARTRRSRPASASARSSTEDACQLTRAASATVSGRRSAAAPSSGSSAAPSVMRATWVEKCRPPPSISAGGPSAITTPWPSSTTRSAKRGRELGVVGGHDHGRARRRRARRCARSARPGGSRSMPRVGSSSSTAAAGAPDSTTSSASRWRSPPERSRGFASSRPASPALSTPRAPASSTACSWIR